ncbi:MAG TPA: WYL domain-containing protein [Nocardioides sp.]|uniref:helix-turn-helix transcriptional regulator n=1 Tax=Nocardioides sp. TaxID=35761 RepID=UPI002CCD44BE|nr:WYL domain-containing protein [Nocardioides sp.]HQR28248.1 WYL domain-containing protein [Nocardioides sp.]
MSAPAAGGAKEQVARLLTLVPYLYSRERVQLDEAAAALGVTPAQLLRDLRVLLMCGLPGGYPDDLIDVDLDALEDPEGDGVVRVSNADYLARPLRLSPTEAGALIVALRALRGGASDETRDVVDRVLAKLEAAVAEGAAAKVDVGEDVDGLAALRALLADALARRRQVRLTYYVPARDEESEREVDPRGLVNAHGFEYLDGWCHSADAPRLFRLDRIHHAVVLDRPVQSPPTQPRDLSEGLFQPSEDSLRVVLRLDPEARWVPDYYPVEDVRRRRGGTLEVTMRVADPRWLQRLLLRLAPHASVVEPPEQAAAFVATATETLRWYS